MYRLDLLGAITATAIFSLCILIFLARLGGRSDWGYWLGIPFLLSAFPIGYLLFRAPACSRPFLYYLQLSLMLAFILLEFALDYFLRLDFRRDTRFVVPYVTLYFAGTGGMIGIASLAGRTWSAIAIVLYLAMAALAFIQRARTGL